MRCVYVRMCVHVCGRACVWMEYFYDENGMEDMVMVVVVVVWVGGCKDPARVHGVGGQLWVV